MITNTQKIYNALDIWTGSLVDQLMSNTSLRVRAKRGISKIIRDRLNLDMVMPFLEDENGELEVDSLSSEVMELLATLPPQTMTIGPVEVVFSGEDIKMSWPKNIFTTMLVGDIKSLRLTSTDIKDLVEIIKQQ